MKKLKPQTVRVLFWAIFGIGAVIALVGALRESLIFGLIGIVVMIAAGIFYYLLYRCPHCGKYLKRNPTKGVCPHCGEKIGE